MQPNFFVGSGRNCEAGKIRIPSPAVYNSMTQQSSSYVLDEGNECLWRDGQRIDLQPKVFRLLQHLSRQPGQLVSKRTLLDQVWADTHVSESALSVAIAQLRDLLGDDPRAPRFIETVHRRGYRWIGSFAEGAVVTQPEAAPPGLLPMTTMGSLVGREAMLDSLRQARSLAQAGRRQLVFLTGEPGIGKSTLADAFLAETAPAAAIGRGQCIEQYGLCEPYMPVLEAMESLCQEPEVQRIVRSHAPTWLLQMPGLASEAERSELRRMLAGSTGERMARELAGALALLARDRLLVLLFEDVHWSDHATVGLLSALAQRREPARLLLLATYRSVDAIVARHPIVGLKRELAAKRQCTEIALEGLDSDAIRAYLAERFPGASFSAALCDIVQTQTTGNPLFLHNAVDELVQKGWLHEEDGVWTCGVPEERLREAVPAAVRDLIEQRFERLDPLAQQVLEAASAVGPVFSCQCVAAALESDAAEVEDVCVGLARAGQLIEPAGSTTWPDGSHTASFAFRHALYHQVFYSRLAPARGARIHVRIAERLEAGYGNRAAEIAAPLAVHFERGGSSLRAAHYCGQAARIALGRYASTEAIEELRHGLELLGGLPPSPERDALELRLQVALISPLIDKEGTGADEVQSLADGIRELSRGKVTTRGTMQALGALGAFHISRGQPTEALAIAREQLARIEAEPQLRGFEPVARFQIGFVELACGRFESAIANLKPAVDLPSLVPLAPVDLNLAAIGNIALGRFLLGAPAEALQEADTACESAAGIGHPFTALYCWWRLQQIAELARDTERASVAAAQMRAIAEQSGFRLWLGIAAMAEAWVLTGTGDPEAGVERAREGVRTIADCGHKYWLPARMATLAGACLQSGRLAEARDAVAGALAYIDSSGERWHEAETRCLQGEIAAAGARFDEAEASFRSAVAVAREQGARWLELRARLAQARLRRQQGRAAALRKPLEACLRQFPAGLELPDLRDARELIASLD